jgi:hypothetical protein
VRLRLRAEPPGEECFASISGVAPLSVTEAWVVGACALRGRLTPTGFVDLHPAAQKIHQRVDLLSSDCDGVAYYHSVVARSAQEAYVAGDTRCGLDPNGIWLRPLERFDGRGFRDLRGPTPFKDARAQWIAQMVLGKSSLYLLAAGDEWTGPPQCGVYELRGERTTLLRACKQPDPRGDHSNEIFSSLGIDANGDLWISAQRRLPDMPDGAPGIPLLLHRQGARWLEAEPAEHGLLRSDARGELWLFAANAWRLTPEGWQKSPLALPADLRDAAVVAANDFWLTTAQTVLHYDGDALRPVAVDELAPDSALHVHARDGGVWLSAERQVWELRGANDPVLAVVEP